jgi:hypothetical protein
VEGPKVTSGTKFLQVWARPSPQPLCLSFLIRYGRCAKSSRSLLEGGQSEELRTPQSRYKLEEVGTSAVECESILVLSTPKRMPVVSRRLNWGFPLSRMEITGGVEAVQGMHVTNAQACNPGPGECAAVEGRCRSSLGVWQSDSRKDNIKGKKC